ncbi:MAG: indole-3-glycerol phosphate synthase TrpC [Bacteroidales bacterium]|nr:indole-3-glycerol phosphate synthase TrpC [Bacteroidales bacterium]
MNILDTIVAHKRNEVEQKKEIYPIKFLEQSIYFETQTVSLQKYIERDDLHGIIAEFKRMSPSKGMINQYAKPEKVCINYMRAGASALSVLTDSKFFGGSNEDLTIARKYNYCPILRKDFIVDTYQIYEAKSIGADAILLIAEVLTEKEMKSFYTAAQSLGLEILFEVHSAESIAKLPNDARIVGVNSRNLESFEVSLEHTIKMREKLPTGVCSVAESGISSPTDYYHFREAGFSGFLIGERFMREANPGKALSRFINSIKTNEYAD